MQQKRDLLRELKIERDSSTESTGISSLWVVATLLLTGMVAALLLIPSEPQEKTPDARTEIVKTQLPTKKILDNPISRPINQVVLNATGYITARRIATVSSKITGKVDELLIEEGDYVQQGALLARLNSDLAEAELILIESRLFLEVASVDELELDLRSSRLKLERITLLYVKNLTSQSSLDQVSLEVEVRQARLARHQKKIDVVTNQVKLQMERLRETEIRAPFNGIIIAKTAQAGEMISPVSAGGGFTRTGIATLVDMRSLEVEVDISETSVNKISKGQLVEVVLNSYPKLKLAAKVITIVPTANRNKATVKIRIGLLTKDPRVIPDMGVKVSFLAFPEQEQVRENYSL